MYPSLSFSELDARRGTRVTEYSLWEHGWEFMRHEVGKVGIGAGGWAGRQQPGALSSRRQSRWERSAGLGMGGGVSRPVVAVWPWALPLSQGGQKGSSFHDQCAEGLVKDGNNKEMQRRAVKFSCPGGRIVDYRTCKQLCRKSPPSPFPCRVSLWPFLILIYV